jgi:hypothetical protein
MWADPLAITWSFNFILNMDGGGSSSIEKKKTKNISCSCVQPDTFNVASIISHK